MERMASLWVSFNPSSSYEEVVNGIHDKLIKTQTIIRSNSAAISSSLNSFSSSNAIPSPVLCGCRLATGALTLMLLRSPGSAEARVAEKEDGEETVPQPSNKLNRLD